MHYLLDNSAGRVRDCFLTSFLDTDATDFTDFHGKEPLKIVFSVKSVYERTMIQT